MTPEEVRRLLELCEVAKRKLLAIPAWKRAMQPQLVKDAVEFLTLVRKAGLHLEKVVAP